ncbi:enoyl-CoA hydratase [Nocardioides humilatus]|nr:enoyl-CoA hydratase [Nocardioides humilatus]
MTELVLLEVADRVATITLNRPDARNALNGDLLDALTSTVAAMDADDGVDVLVLTGADPAFCAGLDLKAVAAGDKRLMETAPTSDMPVPDRGPFGTVDKPLIGAVNGFAITGGFEIALACDFLIASENARFADTHARVGLQPWWGLSVLLPQAIGVRRARQMSATGNFIDARTALEWGLVNQVVPHADLLGVARRLAADIVSGNQAAVRRILKTYAENELLDGHDSWLNESAVAEAWVSGGQVTDLEANRRAVIARGREQA